MKNRMKGWFYYIPIYLYLDTDIIQGRNLFCNILLKLAIKWHTHVVIPIACLIFKDYEPNFPIKVVMDETKTD